MKLSLKNAIVILIALPGLARIAPAQASYSLLSPDKRIEVKVRTSDRFSYDVLFKGTVLLQNSTFSIDIDHNTLGLQPRVKTAKERSYDGTLEPPVRQKFAKVHENYNELRLTMDGSYAVVFRAYNEGVAYRLETSLPQPEVRVYNEESSFNFPDDYRVYFPHDRRIRY
jgi:alpha-glucosidase